MSGDDQDRTPGDDQEDRRRDAGAAWSMVSYLIAGVIAWGGIGWLLDRWLDTSVLLPIGIVIGFGGAFYLIIRRYGGL